MEKENTEIIVAETGGASATLGVTEMTEPEIFGWTESTELFQIK